MSYRSRAAFKLLDLDERYKFLKPGIQAVDLGAAPGSWSQVLSAKLKSKAESPSIVAVDILKIQPIRGVQLFHGDVTETETIEQILDFYNFKKIDLVVSDMAPEFTGDKFIDHSESFRLSKSCLSASLKLLKKGGSLVVKVNQGPLQQSLYQLFKLFFRKLQRVKPSASRKSSQEMYYFCEMFMLSEEPIMKRMRKLEEELQIAKDDPLKRKLLETQKKEEMYMLLSEMVSEMHNQGMTIDEEELDQALKAAKSKNPHSQQEIQALNFLKRKLESTPLRDSSDAENNIKKMFEELSGYTQLDEDKPLHEATQEFKQVLKRQEMIKEHKQKLKARGIDYNSDDIDQEYEAMKREVEINRSRYQYKERVSEEKLDDALKDKAYFQNLRDELSRKIKRAQEEMGERDEEAKLKLKEKKDADQMWDAFFESQEKYKDIIMDKEFEEKIEYQQFKDNKDYQQKTGKRKGYQIRERAPKAMNPGIMWDEDEEL